MESDSTRFQGRLGAAILEPGKSVGGVNTPYPLAFGSTPLIGDIIRKKCAQPQVDIFRFVMPFLVIHIGFQK